MKKIAFLIAFVLMIPLAAFGQTAETNPLLGPCTGDYDNYQQMLECAQKAQYQGSLRGYQMDCTVQVNSAPSATWVNTYTPFCTVNGQPGHQANLLVGFQSTQATNPHINPGWATLNYELSNPPAAISTQVTGQIWTPGTVRPTGTVGTPPTSGTGGTANPSAASTQASYLSSLLSIVNSMVQAYRSLLSPTAQVNPLTQSNNLSNIPTAPAATPPVAVAPTTSNDASASAYVPGTQLAFLRIETINSPSWIAWREIEVYNGAQKLTIATSTGSGNYVAPHSGAYSYPAAYDGNLSTLWNAGSDPKTDPCIRTAQSVWGTYCQEWVYNGWYKVGFNQPAQITRVRLLPALHYATSATPSVGTVHHKVWGSTDGVNWILVKDMNGTFKDAYWAEFTIGQTYWTTTPSAVASAI